MTDTDTIYMQHDCDGDLSTWCVERINGSDTMYERTKRIAALEAEAERLRGALETVEWAKAPFAVRVAFCPWCGKTRGHGHRFDCMRQSALEPSP